MIQTNPHQSLQWHGSTLSSSIFDDLFAKPENSRDFFLVSIHSMTVSGLSNKKTHWFKIRFDQRGQGKTGKLRTEEGYSSKKYADDFVAVIKEFNAKEPILIGW